MFSQVMFEITYMNILYMLVVSGWS